VLENSYLIQTRVRLQLSLSENIMEIKFTEPSVRVSCAAVGAFGRTHPCDPWTRPGTCRWSGAGP